MDRREFLVRVGGTLVAVPMVLEAIGCGSDSSPAAPAPTDRFTVTSSSAGHTHRITFLCTDLTNKFTYTSTVDSGHSHDITLTAGDLTQIAAGAQVGPVTSTNNAGHTHTWTIQKPANVC